MGGGRDFLRGKMYMGRTILKYFIYEKFRCF